LSVARANVTRYNGLSTEEKVDLRRALITFLQKVCSSQEQTEHFVKNKLGQLFALLFKLDFLTTWPTFIDDLLVAVCNPDPNNNHVAIVDMFLRILHSVDEEVVSLEVTRDKEEQKHNQDIVSSKRRSPPFYLILYRSLHCFTSFYIVLHRSTFSTDATASQ
jgi:exportin-T